MSVSNCSGWNGHAHGDATCVVADLVVDGASSADGPPVVVGSAAGRDTNRLAQTGVDEPVRVDARVNR